MDAQRDAINRMCRKASSVLKMTARAFIMMLVMVFSTVIAWAQDVSDHTETLGIIGALETETRGVLALISNPVKHEIATRPYYTGQINDINVVLTISRPGKAASAAAATTMINLFKVDRILFIGTAGAGAPDVRIGDIVIADQVYQHDVNCSPIYKKYEIPEMNKILFDCDNEMSEQLGSASVEFIQKQFRQIPRKLLDEFGIKNPKVFFGKIASGDQFITDTAVTTELNIDFPGTYAVEMEGGPVAEVCFENKIPFSNIRIISDKADGCSHIDFPKFVNLIMKEYISGIISNYTKRVAIY